MLRRTVSALILLGLGLGACKRHPSQSLATATATAGGSAFSQPISQVVVEHGDLDRRAPDQSPRVAAKVIAATIYKLPDVGARRLGYLRLGGSVPRDADKVSGRGCKGDWYRVYPAGYVCTEEVTVNLDDPLVRAASRRPDVTKPLPYAYGFVRATAPQYLRIPTRAEQLKSELGLEEHLAWFAEHRDEVQKVTLGANDVPLDARGMPVIGGKLGDVPRPSTAMSLDELFGAAKAGNAPPFWLQGGARGVPNVAIFKVPDYALFADRVRRKTGLSFVDAFDTQSDGLSRRFAVTVDLRLVPTTKVKPDTASAFHGVELKGDALMPFGWIVPDDASTWALSATGAASPVAKLPQRAIIPVVAGQARVEGGVRYLQTRKDPGQWVREQDIGLVVKPATWPEPAEKGEKWLDISLRQQTLVLYEGKKPVYATLISSGRDGMKDPKTTLSTPMGTFRLRSKHIAAAMDSEENSAVSGGARSGSSGGSSSASEDSEDSDTPAKPGKLSAEAQATADRLRKAVAAGKKLSDADNRRWLNIQKGRDPEYGVTRRRGSLGFELRDVPWIQYFAAGYALHGAYWHDVFGTPRSHGCVNLAPVDARVVFAWTDPPVPEGWHGVNVGEETGQGTTVIIHE